MTRSRPTSSLAAPPRRSARDTRPLAEMFRAQHWDDAQRALPRVSRASAENGRQALTDMEAHLAPTLAPQPRAALLAILEKWAAILAVIPAAPSHGHTDAWIYAKNGARRCALAAAEAGGLFPSERAITFRPSALDVRWKDWSANDATRFFKACALNGNLPRAGCLGVPAALAHLGFFEAAAACLPLSLRQAGDDAPSSRWARLKLFAECLFSSKIIARGPRAPSPLSATGSPSPDWKNRLNGLRQHGVELDGAALAAAGLTPGKPDLALERMRWICAQSKTPLAELATEALACSPAMPLRSAEFLLSMGGRIHENNWLAVVCALKDPAVEHTLRENARPDSERLATLRLYLESGQPLGQPTAVLRHAAQARRPTALKALIESREWTDHAMRAAWIAVVRDAGNARPEEDLEAFREMGAKMGALLAPALLVAAQERHWLSVQWLLKNGAPPAGPKRQGAPLAHAIEAAAILPGPLPPWVSAWFENDGWGPACHQLAQGISSSGPATLRAQTLTAQALAALEAAALRKTLAPSPSAHPPSAAQAPSRQVANPRRI